MYKHKRLDKQQGFTIVELLVVVVVIGILAAIVIVAYNGVQKSATTATIKSDLANAARNMGLAQVDTGVFPDVLPSDTKTSPGITVKLIKRTGGYYNMSDVQNGVLLQTVCQQLVNEGYGTGTNIGGGVEQYITGCYVYGHGAMQINGWSAHDFNTSLGSTDIYNWFNSNVSADAFRPNKKNVYLTFATQLTTRFQALNGSFPVTSFWDPWAAPNNSGVPFIALGTPIAPSDPANFCIEGSHIKYPDVTLYVTQSGVSQNGTCP